MRLSRRQRRARRRRAAYLAARGGNPASRDFLFSILIPSQPSRLHLLARLLAELQRQSEGKPVEILALVDNRARTTGWKRNLLLSQSIGDFVASFDDDDWPAADYIDSILTAIRENPSADVICFGWETVKGSRRRHYFCGLSDEWKRKPRHFMPWRAPLAKQHQFPDSCSGEDAEWEDSILREAKTEARIDKILYYYRFGVGGEWGK